MRDLTDFDINSLVCDPSMSLVDLYPSKETLELNFIDDWDWFFIDIYDPSLESKPITSSFYDSDAASLKFSANSKLRPK